MSALANQKTSASAHLPFGDQRSARFYGKDILSVKQFSIEDLTYIFEIAHEMREMVARVGTFDLLKGKILANLFYEPSTRTSSSFTAAMERLGGSVIPINEVRYSSVSKGESLPDTVRTLECYADVIVLRHPELGASALAAAGKTAKPTTIAAIVNLTSDRVNMVLVPSIAHITRSSNRRPARKT